MRRPVQRAHKQLQQSHQDLPALRTADSTTDGCRNSARAFLRSSLSLALPFHWPSPLRLNAPLSFYFTIARKLSPFHSTLILWRCLDSICVSIVTRPSIYIPLGIILTHNKQSIASLLQIDIPSCGLRDFDFILISFCSTTVSTLSTCSAQFCAF